MSSSPNIVFCTTCKGRAQHIEKTLARNLSDNSDYPNFKIALLDYNSPDHLINHIASNHRRDIDSGRLVLFISREQGPFRMSHAKNMIHRLAIEEGADILVNLDADNYARPGFASWIAEQFASLWEFLWSNAKSVIGRARQGLAGRIAVSRDVFLKVGGYDERYTGWAPEDEDFKARIRRLGYDGPAIPDQFLYVIPHGDGLRFREYPEAKPTVEREQASLKAIREANTTIANFGNLGCGTVFRNFNEPIVLSPIPTRIFGIGMHKTATTSLHNALITLGVKSAHWTSPRWARNVWEEMQLGRSLTVEREYAMSDLPFTMLYKELDLAYPGSKFILTERDEDSWINSVKNHWDHKLNPWRATWDNDFFTHRCHQLLYGQKTFDSGTMLNRYRVHNVEVKEYFKNRPDDLLIINPNQIGTWLPLCAFLKKKVPLVPYPKVFVSAVS